VITIAGYNYGAPLTVKAGTKITVRNTDGVQHTVTAVDGPTFDVPVNAGATATFTAPSTPGTYKFGCTIHPSMHGTLTVTP
jgi:plastocyanin